MDTIDEPRSVQNALLVQSHCTTLFILFFMIIIHESQNNSMYNIKTTQKAHMPYTTINNSVPINSNTFRITSVTDKSPHLIQDVQGGFQQTSQSTWLN